MTVSAKDSAGNLASASQTVTVTSHSDTAATLNALAVDQLLERLSPNGEAETLTAAASSPAAAAHDSNLVAESPYTLADHLWQHAAAHPLV